MTVWEKIAAQFINTFKVLFSLFGRPTKYTSTVELPHQKIWKTLNVLDLELSSELAEVSVSCGRENWPELYKNLNDSRQTDQKESALN